MRCCSREEHGKMDMATVCPLKNVGELTGIYRKKIGRALSYVCFKEVQEWQEEERDEDTFVNWANRDRIKEHSQSRR